MIRPHRPGIAIKKLLAPTDFSEYSRFAMRYAVALAKSFEAKVYVIHVHEPYPQGSALEGIYYDPEIMEEAAPDGVNVISLACDDSDRLALVGAAWVV